MRYPASLACLALGILLACEPTGSDDNATVANDVSDAGVADAEAYALQRLNAYRATVNSPALDVDAKASDFARVASQHRAAGEAAHLYFQQNSASCACGLSAENQGSATRLPTDDPHRTVDAILAAMWAEGPGGGHYEVMISKSYAKVGVGIVITSTALYLTNDFL
jgi:uncharacterized protein YkwD